MLLTDTERVTVLRGYDGRIRSYREVVKLLNATYSDGNPISKSTVERTIARSQRIGLIKDLEDPKALPTIIKL